MLLKKIILENIRSYENQEIDFPEGSVLLSGDIGSGKTSVLLAFEFALFGLQPGQKGNSLLRSGKTQGKVTAEFDVDGKKIMIERTLKKGKTISQDYCALTVNGEKKELSVTELKEQILQLLNYPKEFSRKQNVLYKFTVYTPQEEMKQIILQDAETRMNTLRHVFGIDKYKKILENLAILTLKLREEKRLKEGMTINLEQEKAELISMQEELKEKYSALAVSEKAVSLKKASRKKLQEEKDQLAVKIEEKNKLNQEIEKTKIMIASKKEAVAGNLRMSSQLSFQLKELETLNFDEAMKKQFEASIDAKKAELENFNRLILKTSSELSSFNLKTDDDKKLEKKIASLEICPTCLQNVDAVYRANVLNRIHASLSENSKKIKELEQSLGALSAEKSAAEKEISEFSKKLQELNLLKIRLQAADEKKTRISELSKTNELLEKDIELLSQHIDALRQAVFELGKYASLFEQKQQELDSAIGEEHKAEINFAELKKETQLFSTQIAQLEERIKKMEFVKKQLQYINELEQWLSKDLTSLIAFIEKNVMLKLKGEFSSLFSEWFAMLVSDSLAVRLNDDFTPVIEQQDYELDYDYLSGGERTAIALAYRLSLNQVINSFLSRLKTKDLVILDEPTDGFSDQQLDKMRDVLQQLNVKQLIIVSHEQKIEGFVENVIRFRKDGGVSRKEN